MAPFPPVSPGRAGVSGLLALALTFAALQVSMVRPYLWPAGAGVALSGDAVFASLGEPSLIPRTRPPEVGDGGRTVTIRRVARAPAGAPALDQGLAVTGIYDHAGGRIGLAQGLPTEAGAMLRIWREAYYLGTSRPVTVRVREVTGDERIVTLPRSPVWRADAGTRTAWVGQHGGALLQLLAFLAGALVLVALGTRGRTAGLMTVALIATAVATGGPLYGVERDVPILGGLLLLLAWTATPLAFPIIGMAVLHFPTRAAILDRQRWIIPALALVSAPMLAVSLLTAAFLLGVDGVLPALAWAAAHGRIFDLSFAAALAANLLIIGEGVGRFRRNRDANERRRIQIVVYTGVSAVVAYACLAVVPVLGSLAGRPLRLAWPLQALLQAIVLLPAFGLPYAVAVRHVFSPRTVLRQGLQYALARRTLSVLVALPVAALAVALLTERDRPLGAIVLGQPLFYALSVGLALAGFRYRDAARRWLDRRFFRAEYDGREILEALASRVPFETDPPALVALVIAQVDSALHPQAMAVLAGDEDLLPVLATSEPGIGALPRDGALGTLLHWSNAPLEVFLDDERSPAARLPEADRAWLAASGMSLLVPILAGSGTQRLLAGVIGLGQKKSEEPYTPEDRRLLSAIAAQMSAALDLSRLRRRLSTAPATDGVMAAPAGPGGLPPLIDGRYRLDTVVGAGGMGAVYRAHDLRLGRDVAVKVVRTDLAARPDARQRFEQEALILAQLQHPAIVTIFDFGALPDGSAYLVMELVRGADLRAVLTRERRLPPAQALALVGQLAEAVDFAHRAGVLHRDLKPENVLLPDSGLGPKVLDFGVATLVEPTIGDTGGTPTRGGTIIGTPAYMAPEQLRGERVDGRADIYSLAVMTYEALTGRLPFAAGALAAIDARRAGGTVPLEVEGLPPGLARPLEDALSWSRDDRPATASAFATSLTAASSARP